MTPEQHREALERIQEVQRRYAYVWRGMKWMIAFGFADYFSKSVLQVIDVAGNVSVGPFLFGVGGGFNKYFVFSLPGPRWLIILLAMAVLAAVSYRWWLEARLSKASSLGLAMVIGGAASNLYDRLIWPGVYDWLVVGINGWSSSHFNLADVFIVVGVLYWLARQSDVPGGETMPLSSDKPVPPVL